MIDRWSRHIGESGLGLAKDETTAPRRKKGFNSISPLLEGRRRKQQLARMLADISRLHSARIRSERQLPPC